MNEWLRIPALEDNKFSTKYIRYQWRGGGGGGGRGWRDLYSWT